MSDLIEVFIWSALPLGESKIAIPMGLASDTAQNPLIVFTFAAIGNLLCFPITYLFMNSAHKLLWDFRSYKQFSMKIARRSKKLTKKLTDKYGFWGLMLFVAVPLPTTGAYMGALISWMLGYEKKKAFFAVSLGAFVAAVIVTISTVMIISSIPSD